MERRGQERDREREIGSYRPAESPVKLPLAAILSTPTDRRSGNNNNNNATLPTRRGSSIFSPTQTLDHHLRPQLHHHRHNLTPLPPPPPPPPPHILVKDPSPDPDPSTPTPDGTSDSRTPPSPPQQPPPPPAEGQNNSVIRYRECLKNHAASMGGHVVDGCGEFMPNGDDGTAESLRCAACDCHRNFHRKEVDGEAQPSNFHHYSSNRTPLLNNQTPPLLPSAHRQQQQQGFSAAGMVHFGGGGGADESSSEDLNMYQSSGGGGMGSKKRFRTKFSQEQKDRMQELAEKMEWRIQKQDEQLVQKMCEETGVKRQVFKVWMHNNKQAMKKKHIHQI